jgi:preprotein translocase SecE subunit
MAARPALRHEVENIKTFVVESYQELRKVSWPGQKEVTASSLVVVVVTVLFMLLIVIEDKIIEFGLNAIFK